MPLDVASRDLVILSGVRTAFGTMGGALAKMTAADLAVPTATAALDKAGVKAEDVDHVVYGNVLQTANDAIYMARHIGLRAGTPNAVPALTVNRLCGSGFQSIITGAAQILTGQANVVLCGGTENMSMAPHVTYGLRDGARFGKSPKMQDLLWECLTDSYTSLPMAMTAENLAEFEARRAELEKAAAEAQATAEARKQAIEAMGVIEITARVGSEGKLFGSVGVGDICDAIESLGGDVQKSEVRMPEGALRVTGEHVVDIHLYTDIDTQVTVNIVGEE